MRYKVEVFHGEHASIYYVIDTEAPEGEQPEVVTSTNSPEAARSFAAFLNANVA